MTQFLDRFSAPFLSAEIAEIDAPKAAPSLSRAEIEGLFARELGRLAGRRV